MSNDRGIRDERGKLHSGFLSMRKCLIRIEKQSPADWPPDEIVRDGNRCSLPGIFRTIGISLTKGEDTSKLDAFGQICTTDQLLRHMESCRDYPVTDWLAHIFIVNQIDHHGMRPAGLLLERGRGASGASEIEARRGCAISWAAIESLTCGHTREQAEFMYLRVVAHELGHVFNLGHDERPSLMTPLRWFQRRRTYPENISFDLCEPQLAWLAHGPEDEVRPGGEEYHGNGGRLGLTLESRQR
jgi:hypothetical protein